MISWRAIRPAWRCSGMRLPGFAPTSPQPCRRESERSARENRSPCSTRTVSNKNRVPITEMMIDAANPAVTRCEDWNPDHVVRNAARLNSSKHLRPHVCRGRLRHCLRRIVQNAITVSRVFHLREPVRNARRLIDLASEDDIDHRCCRRRSSSPFHGGQGSYCCSSACC